MGLKPRYITRCEAKRQLEEAGISFTGDFHALSAAHVQRIFDASQRAGYFKSAYAPGSVARMYFHELANVTC